MKDDTTVPRGRVCSMYRVNHASIIHIIILSSPTSHLKTCLSGYLFQKTYVFAPTRLGLQRLCLICDACGGWRGGGWAKRMIQTSKIL